MGPYQRTNAGLTSPATCTTTPATGDRALPRRMQITMPRWFRGGAFFHPSHPNLRQVKEQTLYPSAETSRRAVSARLFNPLHLTRGGYVALLGACVAAFIYFA